jgi:5'-3' exonuclease
MANTWDIPLDFHNKFKAILNYFHLPYIKAKYEGEQLCSMLAVEGKVSAVYSTDTDTFVYGAPLVITGFKSLDYVDGAYQRKCTCVRTENILKELEYNKSKFVDLCILAGCDYNTNIPRVAIKTAHKLLEQYETIDNFPEKYDRTPLNYEKCKELFKQVSSRTLIDETNLEIINQADKTIPENNIISENNTILKNKEQTEETLQDENNVEQMSKDTNDKDVTTIDDFDLRMSCEHLGERYDNIKNIIDAYDYSKQYYYLPKLYSNVTVNGTNKTMNNVQKSEKSKSTLLNFFSKKT